MWEWLQDLSGGAAAFVGSATGSGIGLIALLLGALFNAHLNRRRDDRIRQEETQSLAAALSAELSGFVRTLERNAKELKEPSKSEGFMTPDLSHSVRVMPQAVDKLGLLDVETIRATIDAYILVEQYCETLLLRGGRLSEHVPEHRRLVYLPKEKANLVIAINESIAAELKKAVTKLDAWRSQRGK
jgi:hypothetical protein